MSTWDFKKETGTESALIAGNQPYFEADSLASKRNVINTKEGWVRRTIKTTDGNVRIHDEVLVAAHPGDETSYASNTAITGGPDIAQIYLDTNAVTANTATNVYVVFNEPVFHSGAAGNLELAIANTSGGVSGVIGIANAVNSNTGIVNANNTLVFSFTANTAGSYKIEAQTIANNTATAANLVSLNTGNAVANLEISGPVSNNIGTIVVS